MPAEPPPSVPDQENALLTSPADGEEVEWTLLRDVEDDLGIKLRTLRSWRERGKIRSKVFENRPNAPVYVDPAEVQRFAAEAGYQQEAPETLPIPVEVFERMKDLEERLWKEAAERARAETTAEFLRVRVRELEDRLKPRPVVMTTAPRTSRWRWWKNRQGNVEETNPSEES